MILIRRIAVAAALILLVLLGVLWAGAQLSLDRERPHTAATAALPDFVPGAQEQLGKQERLVQIPVSSRAGNLLFRARIAGFGGHRGNLILLHGFPETSAMWTPLIAAAAAQGYQVVAFDQRGYSPGARPGDTAAYQIEELVADVHAVADAVGFDRFHLVGHDWGSIVSWALLIQDPKRVQSFASLSIPHILAFVEAVGSDPEQQRRSSYIGLFLTPWLPEQLFAFADFRFARRLVYADHAPQELAEYLRVFAEPGALTAAFAWYRAQRDIPAIAELDPVLRLPVLVIWGNEDPAVARTAVETQRAYLQGPFELVELDTGHWLMATATERVVSEVLGHVGRQR